MTKIGTVCVHVLTCVMHSIQFDACRILIRGWGDAMTAKSVYVELLTNHENKVEILEFVLSRFFKLDHFS